CAGIKFADKYKIPVYASEGTLKSLNRLDTGKIIKGGLGIECMKLKDFIGIRAINVMHDAAEPLMYVVQTHDTKISVVMDTGCVTQDMLNAMYGSDVYIIE